MSASGPVPTPSQTVGPFFSFGTDWLKAHGPSAGGDPRAVEIRGRVLDGEDRPVPDAMLEIWQGSQFARSLTDEDGGFRFVVAKPEPGPGGQAPHVDLSVFARGLLQRLVTRIYFPDEPAANDADPVLARVDAQRRPTLVATAAPGYLSFDVRLQGPWETVFFAY